ncbi:hypothetical protein ACFQS4_11895 [Saliphagus sp. GCM10025317]
MSETDADAEPIVNGSAVTEDRAAFNLLFVAMGILTGSAGTHLWTQLDGWVLETPTWMLVACVVIYGTLSIVGAVVISPDDVY